MAGLLSKLLPRERSFFAMLGELAETVHEGSSTLVEMLREYRFPSVQADRIKELEHRGDTITHDVITRLNQTFITPFDREDIHLLASRVDDVLDLTDAAASRLVLYRIRTIRTGVEPLAEILQQATARIRDAIHILQKRDHVLEYCIEINRLENDADRLSRDLIARLFDEEKDPVEILKWKEIIEVLETATDKCEDVANVIETIILKNG